MRAMTAIDIEQFQRDGFTVVPNAISPEQVASLREYLIGSFEQESTFKSDTPYLRADLCARHPETRFLLAQPALVQSLKALLGDDFAYLPEMAAHSSFFSTWHKDTQSQEAAGHEFQWSDDYLMVEAAIYLQDNNEKGGGLEVVPGSHRIPAKTRLERARQWLRRKRPYSIPSKAGDLILFDFRIDHRASRPKRGVKQGTGKDRKLAIFFACSRDNQHIRSYMDFLKEYSPMSYIGGHEYPPELVEYAKENGLNLTAA